LTDQPGSAAPAGRTTSELALRIVSALVMAALALGAAWWGGAPFAVFWTLAAILLLREWLAVVGTKGWQLTAGWLAGAVAIAAAGVFAESQAVGLLPVLILLAGAVIAGILAPGPARLPAFAGVFYAAVIAVVPVEVRGNQAHGLVAVLWMFAITWGTDIIAYFTGRSIGGPKLWPRLSPKKTWSGFIGGVIGGAAAGVALVQVARYHYGLGWYSEMALVILSVLAAVLSQGGDLLESALKRRYGVKDAGHLIPGHGGVMDRLDSFFAVCVLMGVLLHAGPGPG
jgi:phosphatidate cytidylyltransferase